MQNDIPQFVLKCIQSDYPYHLLPGIKYKVDTTKKNPSDLREISVFWFHPMQSEWVFIGYFPLSCFDSEPIRAFVRKKKGIIEEPRSRVRQTERQRPQRIRQGA